MYLRRQFLEHIAQTSEIPQGFEIDHAEGCYLYDRKGDRYLDLISGFGVNNIGHSIPSVIDAIKHQSGKYLHTNVYGEHVQNPQVELATYLSSLLPPSLNSYYFLNSGSECVDAAIKLVRLATGRSELVVSRCKSSPPSRWRRWPLRSPPPAQTRPAPSGWRLGQRWRYDRRPGRHR